MAYPILKLERRDRTRWYVDRLEDAIIELLGEFNLKGEKSPHTGVWIGDNKICAMGINAQREVTSHGLEGVYSRLFLLIIFDLTSVYRRIHD